MDLSVKESRQFGPYTLIYQTPNVPKAERNGAVVMAVKDEDEVLFESELPKCYRDVSTIDENTFVQLVSAVVEAENVVDNVYEYFDEVEDVDRELINETIYLEDRYEQAMDKLEEYLTSSP